MTQVFADDDQVGSTGMRSHGGQIPIQAAHHPSSAFDSPSALGPAMMPGKGVRRIRCVGCSRDTLPRHDDGAPLCTRCSELLASAENGVIASMSWPSIARTPRWLRRRPALD